ncbi:MAG: hypothetical protein GY795_35695 [Desulfobacterales bacterium]|nr:hypothetical protein [Desulfobacterales bacterium]
MTDFKSPNFEFLEDIDPALKRQAAMAAIGDPLKPYEQRVDEAVSKIMASREWSRPQQQWLQRIAAQMKKEIIVDQESMNKAQFRDAGGFKRINNIFNGELARILEDITEQVWEKRA